MTPLDLMFWVMIVFVILAVISFVIAILSGGDDGAMMIAGTFLFLGLAFITFVLWLIAWFIVWLIGGAPS